VLQQLPAGAHRLGRRRSLTPLAAQIHCALQHDLKRLANRLAALLQLRPLDEAHVLRDERLAQR
jgi:hypothetical protein